MSSSITEILHKNSLVKKVASWFDLILKEEQDSDLFSVIIKGASGSFILKVAFTGFNLIISIILARILGVAEYGTYAYVMSWILLLGVPASLGLDQLMVRFIATYHRQGEWGKINGLIRYSNIAVFIVSAFIALTVYLFIQFAFWDENNSTVYTPLLLALLLLPLNSILGRQGAALRGFQWIISGQIPSMFMRPLLYIILIGTIWLFFKNSLDVSLVISLNIAATGVALVIAGYLLLRIMPEEVKENHPVYEFREWIYSALPLMLMSSMYMINGQADILMLGYIKGTELSGIYQIADRGAGLILFVLGAVITSFSPIIARLYAGKDIEKLQRMVTKATRLTLLLSLPVAICLIVFGKWILNFFGSGFVKGFTALSVLAFFQLIHVASGPVASILVMTGHERDAAIGLGISTIINIMLNLSFIKSWGLEGAAFATGISIIVWNMILIWFVMKRTRINPTILSK